MNQEQSKGNLPGGMNGVTGICRCPGCGTLAYSQDHYCARCGWALTKVTHAEQLPEPDQHSGAGRCTACGGLVTHPVAYFCTDCGAGL